MNLLSGTQTALLALLSSSLFGQTVSLPTQVDWVSIQKEAAMQAVSPLVYLSVAPMLPSSVNAGWKQTVYKMIAANINIEYEHYELHELLRKFDISYVILKGVASASYYPVSGYRSMGDVDFLVHETDIEAVDVLLKSIGFEVDSAGNGGIHIAYHRGGASMFHSIWEIHRSLKGIPKGAVGNACREYLSDIIETAILRRTENGSYMVPDDFHHGIVLLLHTAAHLTSEGIGLRHLCDWAVFVASLSDEAFAGMYTTPLKAMGLWRFAQLLTLTSVKYLGCPERMWAGTADDQLLERIMADILAGGNFGKKNVDRYRQIKYIANRDERTIGNRSLVRQVLHTFNVKTNAECKFVQKIPALLPAGWVVTGCRYIGLVVTGKRKLDTSKTLSEAAERKDIYAEFHLFE